MFFQPIIEKIEKRAIMDHAVEWLITVYSPKISAQTEFSLTAAQKTLFCPKQHVWAETFPPDINALQPQFFCIATLQVLFIADSTSC
jgi:hypothetical protein